MDISKATKANWKRLKTNPASKLRRGANKSRSGKRIYPVEYISNSESLKFAQKVIQICETCNISREDAIFTLAVRLLQFKGIYSKKHVADVLQQYPFVFRNVLNDIPILTDEYDILGFVYQCMLSEGEKNISGSYFTPHNIVESMIGSYEPGAEKTFFDPCCGSGAFLTAVRVSCPNQLFGCDKDSLAVFIAKVNLLCKFSSFEFVPQIYCCDYLSREATDCLPQKKFDFIATNPPWGAEKNSKKKGTADGDSFSRFFCKAKENLKPDGVMDFLFPESVLRIKTHAGLRKFILTECCLEKIVLLQGTFSGVMTGYVDIQVSSKSPSEKFSLFAGNQMRTIDTCSVLNDRNLVFSTASGRDMDILNKIEKLKCRYLDSSVFALGIVTGDNKRFVSSEYKPGMEKIYTGKEVTPYVMKEPKKYLHYLPFQFQQTAKNECYFAEEKLIYKFISGYPVFAYDAEKTLVLNSANILIPKVPGMCIKTVLGFLNSRVLRYFYMVKFQDIKVLKSNLLQLPIPETDQELSQKIRQLTECIIAGDVSAETELQNIIYRCYKITDDDIEYIENYLASHC